MKKNAIITFALIIAPISCIGSASNSPPTLPAKNNNSTRIEKAPSEGPKKEQVDAKKDAENRAKLNLRELAKKEASERSATDLGKALGAILRVLAKAEKAPTVKKCDDEITFQIELEQISRKSRADEIQEINGRRSTVLDKEIWELLSKEEKKLCERVSPSWCLVASGKAEIRVDSLTKEIIAGRDTELAYFERGNLFELLEKPGYAFDDYGKAIQKNENAMQKAHHSRLRLAVRMGWVRDARSVLNRMQELKLKPEANVLEAYEGLQHNHQAKLVGQVLYNRFVPENARDDLIRALVHPTVNIRRKAAIALKFTGKNRDIFGKFEFDNELVTALGKALHDEDDEVATNALSTLFMFPTKHTSPVLLEALEGKNPRYWVAHRIGDELQKYWGEEKATAFFVENLKNKAMLRHASLCYILSKNITGASGLVADLLPVMDKKTQTPIAIEFLQNLRKETLEVRKEALPGLFKASVHEWLKKDVAIIFGKFGISTPEITSKLEQLRKDANSEVREAAEDAIRALSRGKEK